ncbi:hypothetical protein [Amycolatopsis aidingensis]|uniref:hypothetical protein n=1 Tax=Amycolatopsis aidingensis TaxID=2842453 RepID=UPI001C0C2661|nr:hypothetical protein [Amycolatopsis aidingensis]
MTEHEERVLNGDITRTDRVVSWIGWHIGELVAVGLPLLLAVTVTVWAAALAVLAGAVWTVHEVRHALQQRALRAQSQRRQLASGTEDASGEQGSTGVSA